MNAPPIVELIIINFLSVAEGIRGGATIDSPLELFNDLFRTHQQGTRSEDCVTFVKIQGYCTTVNNNE